MYISKRASAYKRAMLNGRLLTLSVSKGILVLTVLLLCGILDNTLGSDY